MKKHKLDDFDGDVKPIFENPEVMVQELDSFLYFLRKRYGNKKNEISNMLGFIITEVEVLFDDCFKSVKLKSELANNLLYICAPLVPEGEKETRRIFLLNSFSDVIKRNQIASIIEFLRYFSPEAKEKMIEVFSEYQKSVGRE